MWIENIILGIESEQENAYTIVWGELNHQGELTHQQMLLLQAPYFRPLSFL